MSAEEVANAFVNHYYQSLNTNPDALAGLFVSTESSVVCVLPLSRLDLTDCLFANITCLRPSIHPTTTTDTAINDDI
jgi:hypothetical protein